MNRTPEEPSRHKRPVRLPSRPRSSSGPIPASGAWQPEHGAGDRRFVDIGPLSLEAGGRLPGVRLAYETWGELNSDGSNAVLLLHALTGDSHVIGQAGNGHATAGWWEQIVGPGRAIDTDKYFVVAPNVLGGCQGSTGPSSAAPDGTPWGSRFPLVTVRDQVAAEAELTDHLGIESWALVLGASMGGHRALEWATSYPNRVHAVAAIATSSATSGDQIAWAQSQIQAIRLDPKFRGGDYYDAALDEGPHAGLGLARQIAHTTYRSALELDQRFGRLPQGGEEPLEGGRFAMQSYLQYHGDKLARRFDANSYVVLTQSMLTHDLGRDRGGVDDALRSIRARVLAVAVDTDRLFLPEQSLHIASTARNGHFAEVHSPYGHDGFLIECDQLGPILVDFLEADGDGGDPTADDSEHSSDAVPGDDWSI